MIELETYTILKTDIRGFTERSGRISSTELGQLLGEHRELTGRVARRFGGRVFKELGDSFLIAFRGAIRQVNGDSYFMTFPTVDAAARAVQKLRLLLDAHPTDPQSGLGLSVAAGLDRGTLNIYRTAIFGRVASRASWLCALAEDLRERALILMTRAAFSALGEELREQCEPLGDLTPEQQQRLEGLGIEGVVLVPAYGSGPGRE